MVLKLIILNLLFTSCSFFHYSPSLKSQESDRLLNSIKIVGEGRGRLSFEDTKHVFSFEAVLREDKDWLLAVSIPLYGEEILTFKNLAKHKDKSDEISSFESRIHYELSLLLKKNPKLPKTLSNDFISDVFSLNRFLLAQELGLKRTCVSKGSDQFECECLNEKYVMIVQEKTLIVKKVSNKEYVLELRAKNLTGPIFQNVTYHFHSRNNESTDLPEVLLELFWK